MRKLLFFLLPALGFIPFAANAQCTVNGTATAGLTLQCNNLQGQTNRSGLAFNPGLQLYYSVDAGSSSYPIETFSATGTSLASIAQGFDYRGLWWNAHTSQLEGNGYNTYGVVSQNLAVGTGYPLGSYTTLLSSAQPDAQSVGDYDTAHDYIIYYYSGSFYMYHRSNNTSAGTLAITGLPVPIGNLNNNTAFYTGCPGQAYGVYDYVNKAFYFINENTGAYVTTSQLSVSAPAASSFQAHMANFKLWLFDNSYQWHSYDVMTFAPTCPATDTALGDTSFCAGDSVILKGNTGTGLTYQWLSSNSPITGATDSTYTVHTTGDYSVIVTNGACFDTAANIHITVHPLPTPNVTYNSPTHTMSVTSTYATYSWTRNGTAITGATNISYTATQNGSYNVTVTDTNGCSGTSNTIIVTGLTVQNVATETNLSLYPNPNNGSFSLNGIISGNNAEIEIYDAVGRTVYKAALKSQNGAVNQTIKLDKSLMPGAYIIRVNSDNSSQQLRFIKQ